MNYGKPVSSNGEGAYVFVSFAEADRERAESFISAMQELYRVRFSAGSADKQQLIAGCAAFVCVVTGSYFEPNGCCDDMDTAFSLGKTVVPALPDSTAALPETFSSRFDDGKILKLDLVNTDLAAARSLLAYGEGFKQAEIEKKAKAKASGGEAHTDDVTELDEVTEKYDWDKIFSSLNDDEEEFVDIVETDTDPVVGGNTANLREVLRSIRRGEKQTKSKETLLLSQKELDKRADIATLAVSLLYIAASCLTIRFAVPNVNGWLLKALVASLPMLVYSAAVLVLSLKTSLDGLSIQCLIMVISYIVSLIFDMLFLSDQRILMRILIGFAYKVLPAILGTAGIFAMIWFQTKREEDE